METISAKKKSRKQMGRLAMDINSKFGRGGTAKHKRFQQRFRLIGKYSPWRWPKRRRKKRKEKMGKTWGNFRHTYWVVW